MAKVIIVKYKGDGKYQVKAEGSKALTVSEMQEDIVKDCSANTDNIAKQIALHYLNNVLNWNKQGNIKLHQGQMPNNDYVFVLEYVKTSCYSD